MSTEVGEDQAQIIVSTPYANIDTRLGEMLQQELGTDDQQQFVLHFQMYLTYGRDDTQFVVDLDTIWKWIGFATKGSAKRLLLKTFEKEEDYVIIEPLNLDVKRMKGGQNKQTVKMNVNTFKAFCMTANTERGKTTRKYYSKMENIFFKYCEEQNKVLIESMEIDARISHIKNNHDILLTAHKRTPLVYMMLVKCPHIEEGNKLIKIGCTDDIHDRVNKLRSQFGCDVFVLHVFPCEDNRSFEKFLFSHHKISPLKYTNLVGPKQSVSTECFLMKSDNMLNCIKRVLEKHSLFYKTRNMESKRLQLQLNHEENESHRLQLHRNLLETFIGNPEGYLHALELMQQPICIQDSIERNQVQQTYEIELEPQIQTITSIPCNKQQGPKVQLYDGSDITKLIKVFNGITEATREIPKSSFTAIKFAATHKLLYLGYRWHFIDRHDENPEMVRNIGYTVTTITRRTGYVAMLDLDRSTVLQVFSTQKDASEHISQHVSALCVAIKYTRQLSGYYWVYWEDVEECMKQQYLDSHVLPSSSTKLRGVSIEQLDPDTLDVVKVHTSIMDVVKEFKMSPKTVKQAVVDEKTYKGFIWKIKHEQ